MKGQTYILTGPVFPNTTQIFDRVMRINPNTGRYGDETISNFYANNLKVVGSNPAPATNKYI